MNSTVTKVVLAVDLNVENRAVYEAIQLTPTEAVSLLQPATKPAQQ